MATSATLGQPEDAYSAVGANPAGTSYLEWGTILGGAIMASAISALLLGFGSAIGLSITSAMPARGISATGFVVAVTIWAVWVEVSSFIAGGYLAGRMRRRTGDGAPAEVETRDGTHGLMVWAVGTFVATVILAGAATSIVRTGAEAAATIAGTAGATVAAGAAATQNGAASPVDPLGYTVDSLFRSDNPAPQPIDPSARQELVRILAMSSAQGQMAPEDKSYVARLVAARTGMSQPDAQHRVDEVLARADSMAKAAEAKVRDAAETARKSGMMLAFLAVATTLVSAAASWWAAKLGGKHRDEGTHFGHYFRYGR
ncbi:MAG: hypothetical protein IT563_25650 [Alphaproteobacteria bacterium]|nr:hypothetical protein [Alphaproteobacteria bacterium]